MAATCDHYDVTVIGSGPGGASLAHRLAATGKRILMLERGGYLPRSRPNWDSKTVFVDATYQSKETWYGRDGSTFHPGLHYFVVGRRPDQGEVGSVRSSRATECNPGAAVLPGSTR
jgi:choline dehydrogenase-like flavoprotein